MPLSFLILIAVVAALIIVATKLGAHGIATLIGLCVLVMVALVGIRSMEVATTERANVHSVATAVASKPEPSTEAMWEHLNRSRIHLDAESKPTAKVLVVNTTRNKSVSAETAAVEMVEESTSVEKPRPNWVDTPPKRVGNVYREVLSSGPYRSVAECHRELEPRLIAAVQHRIKQLTPTRYQPTLKGLGLGLEFVLREICHEEWIETTEHDFGEMNNVHVLMEFDAAVDKQLSTAYRDYERKFRVREVGGIAGLGVGCLALIYGMLKIDTLTRGYYTKRLFFGVPAVIIAIVLMLIA